MINTPLLDGDYQDYDYNHKEVLFCQNYVKTHNGKFSAIQDGYAENSAHVTASRMLKTEKINHWIRSIKGELEGSLRAHFLADALVARQVMYDIMNDSEVAPGVRFQVAKDFLDRAGFKEVEKKKLPPKRPPN